MITVDSKHVRGILLLKQNHRENILCLTRQLANCMTDYMQYSHKIVSVLYQITPLTCYIEVYNTLYKMFKNSITCIQCFHLYQISFIIRSYLYNFLSWNVFTDNVLHKNVIEEVPAAIEQCWLSSNRHKSSALQKQVLTIVKHNRFDCIKVCVEACDTGFARSLMMFTKCTSNIAQGVSTGCWRQISC